MFHFKLSALKISLSLNPVPLILLLILPILPIHKTLPSPLALKPLLPSRILSYMYYANYANIIIYLLLHRLKYKTPNRLITAGFQIGTQCFSDSSSFWSTQGIIVYTNNNSLVRLHYVYSTLSFLTTQHLKLKIWFKTYEE